MTVDKDFLLNTACDLIRINSVNPTLVPGGAGEREIAQYVAGVLRQMNVEVQLHEPQAGRISVAGILNGKGGGRSLMLNAHMDTVGIEGMPIGLLAEVRNGRLYGRGACDMKGSLAACLAAMKALAEMRDGLKGEVVLAAVADEEYESIGTADFVRHHKTDAAIVTEATELDLCLAHKGFAWLEVQTFGRAAHGSRFEEGIDANMRMGRFLASRMTMREHSNTEPRRRRSFTEMLSCFGPQIRSCSVALCALRVSVLGSLFWPRFPAADVRNLTGVFSFAWISVP